MIHGHWQRGYNRHRAKRIGLDFQTGANYAPSGSIAPYYAHRRDQHGKFHGCLNDIRSTYDGKGQYQKKENELLFEILNKKTGSGMNFFFY